MRVKLSYTTDFDDVPNEVRRILDLKTNISYVTILDSVHKAIEDKNYTLAIEKIEFMRQRLNSVDIVLNDCQSILTGYTKALVTTENTNDTTDGE